MIRDRLVLLSVCLTLLMGGNISALEFQDWPTVYVTEDMTDMDILMDVGYFIVIVDQGPIHVSSDITAPDPYHTYEGCKSTNVESNFWARLYVEAAAVSAAGGYWSATVEPDYVPPGTTTIQICVVGEDVRIENLFGGAQEVKVAEITMSVLPL